MSNKQLNKKSETTRKGAVEINEEALDQAAGGFSWGATQTGSFSAGQDTRMDPAKTGDTRSLNFIKIEFNG